MGWYESLQRITRSSHLERAVSVNKALYVHMILHSPCSTWSMWIMLFMYTQYNVPHSLHDLCMCVCSLILFHKACLEVFLEVHREFSKEKFPSSYSCWPEFPCLSPQFWLFPGCLRIQYTLIFFWPVGPHNSPVGKPNIYLMDYSEGALLNRTCKLKINLRPFLF